MFSHLLRYSTTFLRWSTLLFAVAGFAGVLLISKLQAERETPPPGDPPVPPPSKPFQHSVAATGIIEALSDNVAIGVPVPGLVTEIAVKVNDAVKKGDILFRLDHRDLDAERLSTVAQQQVAKAQVAVSEAQLGKLRSQLERLTSISDSRAVSRDEVDNRQKDVAAGEAQLAAARAQLLAAEASIQRIDLLIERLTVRSPRDGAILQVNLRAGEYAANGQKLPAMIVGEIGKLQVRADVDEQNATRIRPGQKAEAYLKGDPKVRFPLEFIRVEPYIIPKVSLTGASTERVDTRVLQVIYSLTPPQGAPIYVGQQVDLFIEAPERPNSP